MPVSEEKLVAVVPENHALADRNSVTIKELGQYPQVTFTPASGLYHFIDPVMLVYIIPELLHKRTWIPVFHHSHVYVTTAVQILNI